MQPLAETGMRLDDRYRLVEDLRSSSGGSLWRATDEVLGRQVAVRIVPGQTKAQSKAITAAVTKAGQVPDARWVRVLDVGSEPVDKRLTVWVVSEWVDGPSLASLIRQDPLPGPAATALVLSCTQAVVAAGRHGVTHGCLHPDEVLVPADGQPRLTGLELTSALHACTATPDAAASAYDDTRALGALLYACLTGRWPLPGWGGLPSPVRGDGAHPRQQRGGVSRELDDITARAVSGGYDSPAALAGDLASLPMSPLHPAPADPAEIGDRRWRRVAWWVVPPVLVAAIGFGAWTLGSDLGRVPSPARAAVAHLPQPHRHSGGGTHRLVWSKPPQVTSFDPQGDGTEDPGGVGLAVDDDPSTQWTTDIYHDSPQFGGLKRGVGLLLDLGRPKQVSTAELLLSEPGASLQIRAGDSPPQRPTDLPLVVARSDTPATAHLRLTTTVRARYWLVWFTTLPATGSDYQIGVGEIALQH